MFCWFCLSGELRLHRAHNCLVNEGVKKWMSDLAGKAGPDDCIMGSPRGREPASLWASWSLPVNYVRTFPDTFRSSSPKAATFPLSSGEAFELQDVKSHEIRLSRVSKSPGSEESLRSLSSLSLPSWCDWHWLRVAVLYYFLSDYFKMVRLPLNFFAFPVLGLCVYPLRRPG